MSTQERADNELDDWFKKSLEEPDISFDPQAWQAMQAKLDKDRSDRVAYWTFFGLLALLLVSMGIGIWYWRSHELTKRVATVAQMGKMPTEVSPAEKRKTPAHYIPDGEKISQGNAIASGKENSGKENRETSKTDRKKTASDIDAGVAPESENSAQNLENQPDTLTISALKAKERDVILAATESRKGRSPKGKNQHEGRINAKGNLPNSEGPTADHRQPAKTTPGFSTAEPRLTSPAPFETAGNKSKEKHPVKYNTQQHDNTDVTKRISEQGAKGRKPVGGVAERESEVALVTFQSVELNGLAIRPFRLIPINQTAAENALQQLLNQHPGIVISNLKQDNPAIAKKRALPWLNKMSLSAMVAPDLSTVRFAGFTAPGTTQGLAFAYQLNDRFSVSVGALYSIKRYYAGAKDYTPAGPWPSPAPYRVNGNCNVIDLPLNLRYNTLMGEKFNVYMSGGLSSYLMQKEHYEYEYTTWSKSWDAPKRNQHWLGVLNLSAGYERKLNSRLSLQVEPYLKLPLVGVGAGKVKLSSTGAFISLKYRLHR